MLLLLLLLLLDKEEEEEEVMSGSDLILRAPGDSSSWAEAVDGCFGCDATQRRLFSTSARTSPGLKLPRSPAFLSEAPRGRGRAAGGAGPRVPKLGSGENEEGSPPCWADRQALTQSRTPERLA